MTCLDIAIICSVSVSGKVLHPMWFVVVMIRLWQCSWYRLGLGSAFCHVPLWIPWQIPIFMQNQSQGFRCAPIQLWCGAVVCTIHPVQSLFLLWHSNSNGSRAAILSWYIKYIKIIACIPGEICYNDHSTSDVWQPQ